MDSASAQLAHHRDLKIYLRLLGYVDRPWLMLAYCVAGYTVYSVCVALLADSMQFLLDTVGGEASQGEERLGIISSLSAKLQGGAGTQEINRLLVPGAIFILVVLRGVGFVMGALALQYVAERLVHKLRCVIFGKLMVLPGHYYDSTSSGKEIGRIVFNVGQAAGAVANALQVLLREGLTLVALMAYMLFLNWQLTLVFVLLGPFLLGLVVLLSRRMRIYSKRIQASFGRITQIAGEAVKSFREIRVFDAQRSERERFAQVSRHSYQQTIKREAINILGQPVIQVLVGAALCVLVWAILSPQMFSRFTPGQLVAFLIAAGLVAKPIKQISGVLSVLQSGLAASEEIFEFLDRQEEADEGGVELERARGTFEFRNVSFTYWPRVKPVRWALQGLDLQVEAGQRVAIVGKSGSGKSTLAKLLVRFYACQEGEILLDGRPVADYRLKDFRRQFSLVSQSATLFNDTVRNNIAYGELAGVPDERVVEAGRMANALQFIEALPKGWDTRVGDDGDLLSGGQRQRIAIARAFLKDAPVLILDEATSSLDMESERNIQEAMDEVMKGRTTFIIAHRLATILAADLIVVLDQGRIVETGRHEQLIDQGGVYSRFYRDLRA